MSQAVKFTGLRGSLSQPVWCDGPKSVDALRLCGVSLSFPGSHGEPQMVFEPSDLDIPLDRSVALLGRRQAGKTALLRLLAGRLRPASGRVARPSSLSPIINAGRFLHMSMAGLENIRFIARTYGLQADAVTRAVVSFCAGYTVLTTAVRNMDSNERRRLEVAVAMALPFGCYLLDDAQQIPPALMQTCREATRARCAGLIFATHLPRLVGQYADAAVVVANRTLRMFNDPGKAIKFFEKEDR
jgi:capsular polysaccharide transport system ATP-binding protein